MSNSRGVGSHKKNDVLRSAADIHIKIGHVQRYCELLVEIGEVRSPSVGGPETGIDNPLFFFTLMWLFF